MINTHYQRQTTPASPSNNSVGSVCLNSPGPNSRQPKQVAPGLRQMENYVQQLEQMLEHGEMKPMARLGAQCGVVNDCACSGAPASSTPTALAESVNSLLTPDAQGNIHEEELQFALLAHLLEEHAPGAGEKFQALFDAVLASAEVSSAEDAVKLALQQLVEAGVVSKEAAEQLNGVAFRAAQLDDNHSALFDNRGSAADNTIAVMNMDQAIEKADVTLSGIRDGSIQVESRSLTAASNQLPHQSIQRSLGGGEGFLWKPRSEQDNKLVVLLPSQFTGQVQSLTLHSSLPPSTGNMIDEGQFAGSNHNGGRAHFRFNRSGGAYPDGVYAVARMRDGSMVSFQVGDSSSRNENASMRRV